VTRRLRRSRPWSQHLARPAIDQLESRLLLTVPSLVAHPTFVLGPFGGGGSPPAGAFTPAQIQEAYAFNGITFGSTVGDGSGQTIAIVDAYDDPNIQSDLNTFDTQFGLPAITVTRVNQTGGTSYPATDPTGGWEGEESLDVEWAHAMAPGASITLVEADSDLNSDLFTAVSYASAHANVVSMSFGGSEFSGETGYDTQYFSQAGVAFVASSGDSGAPASYPATSPNVLAVGGTTLTLGTGNVWSSEVGWSGSGGGPSADESQPSYQTGVVTQTSTARANPDVAYDADPATGFAVYDSFPYQGTPIDWGQVGGTSAGAPQWAALLAIADQGRALNGLPALDSTNPQQVMDILYANPADFHDITSGTSTGNPQYSAGPGYDYVTGLGTPIANLVVDSLNPPLGPDTLVLTASAPETAGTPFSLTVTAERSNRTTDTGFTGTIHFTSSDLQAALPPDFTFPPADGGTASFMVTLKTAGSQSITATDTTTPPITGTLSGISVSPAAASGFVLSGLPSTTTAGEVQTLTVTAKDPYGNVATGYTGTVQFTSTDIHASLPPNYTFATGDHGVHPFTLALDTAGTQSVTVTDISSGFSATQTGIVVHAAAAERLMVTGFPLVDTAGAAGNVVVTAYDPYGNVAIGYTGTVSLTSSDPHAVLPSSFTFPGTTGAHTFTVTLKTAGLQSITATDTTTSSITGTESSITVNPAAAATLQVTGFPTADIAGTAGNETVTAYDPYGNVATGYTGTISFSSSDPRALLPADYPFVAGDVGTHAFSVTLETVGIQSITATDTTTASITGTESNIRVRALPQVTWNAPEPIVFGTPLGNAQFDAQANVPGTFTYTPAAGTILGAGSSQTLSVSFAPTDSTDYATTSATTTITVNQATPTIALTAQGGTYEGNAFPASVTIAGYSGTPGSSLEGASPSLSYYSGTYSNVSQLAGLTPLTGAPVEAGAYTVLARFSGTTDYRAATALTDFTIAQATPLVTWGSLSSITFGTPLGTTQLDAQANVPGTFSYTPAAGTILGAGSSQTLSASFAPTDSTDYATASATITITVMQATPTIALTAPGGTYTGNAFPASVTIAGYSGTPGSSVEGASPVLSYYSGTYSSVSQLAGLTPLTGAPVEAGAYTVLARFSGTTDYTAATALASFAITRATPRVTWNTAATIVFATPLGNAQLDAQANVPGTLTYTPGAGAIVDAGTSLTLSLSFAPTDSTDYTPASATTTITITPATPTIALTARGGTYDGSPFPASVTIAGFSGVFEPTLESESPSLTYYNGTYSNASQLAGRTPLAGTPVDAGAYTVLASYPGAPDYTTATALADFTIARATPRITWNAASPIAFGTPLGTAQLDAQTNVPGTFAYTQGAGTTLNAGLSQTLSATFTPTDTLDYNAAVGTTTITVIQATPTIGLSATGGTFDGNPFPASVTIAGTGNDSTPSASLEGVAPVLTYYVGTGSSGTSLGQTPPIHAGIYSVVATFPGSTDYSETRSTPVSFTIGKATHTIGLTSSGGSSVFGQTVAFVATVTAGAATSGGTVTFYDGSKPLGTAPLSASGNASLTTSALAVGSHSITAVLGGNADLFAAPSGATAESVAQAATQVVLIPAAVHKKKAVVSLNLEAQVQPIAPGSGVPTGTVTFEIQTKSRKTVTEKVLGTAALSGGAATLVVKPSRVLKKTIIILYGGDADYKSSTAMPSVLTQGTLKSLARPMAALQARGHLRIEAAIAPARVRRA